jgi:hypothetical protein
MSRFGRHSRRAFLISVASIGSGLALGYMTTPDPPGDEAAQSPAPFWR